MRMEELLQHRRIDASHVGRARALVFIANLDLEEGKTKDKLVEALRLLNDYGASSWEKRGHCNECGAPASAEIKVGCIECLSGEAMEV